MKLIWTEHKGPCESQELDYEGADAVEYKVLILRAMICVILDLVSVIFFYLQMGLKRTQIIQLCVLGICKVENKDHL